MNLVKYEQANEAHLIMLDKYRYELIRLLEISHGELRGSKKNEHYKNKDLFIAEIKYVTNLINSIKKNYDITTIDKKER